MSDLIGTVVIVIIVVVVLALILAYPIMLLWNGLMPDIFGLKEITFMQALGLNLLSGFLIKSSSVKS